MLLRMLARPLPPSRWPIFALIEPLKDTSELIRRLKNPETTLYLHIEWILRGSAASEHFSYRSCFRDVPNLCARSYGC